MLPVVLAKKSPLPPCPPLPPTALAPTISLLTPPPVKGPVAVAVTAEEAPEEGEEAVPIVEDENAAENNLTEEIPPVNEASQEESGPSISY